ncbi:MAG: c-type cytochrome [Pseudomonadota bacterium]
MIQRIISVVVLFFILFSSSVVFSDNQDASEEPAYEIDLGLGEEINEVCAGCHGEFAEGGKGGEYPRLAGFPQKYLREQLGLFKNNQRHNLPMKPYANDRELPDDDIYSVTAYIETIKLQTKIPDFKADTTAYEKLLIAKKVLNIPRVGGDIQLGKKLYNKECKICHGVAGKGKKKSDTPPLSGQYTQYLRKQIIDYNAKKRHHDYDDEDEAFKAYSEEQIQALLAYLSITDD